MEPRLLRLEETLATHVAVLQQTVAECGQVVAEVIELLVRCFQRGNKLLLCGNGGSAADAQHVAAELVNRFQIERAALPAIALTTDTSILTCISNDTSYDRVFSRQVEALGRPGDVLAGISTSGRSPNVLLALRVGRALGLVTIGFTGLRGRTAMATECDHCVVVPSFDTARIQEAHAFLWHVICGEIEQSIAGQPPAPRTQSS